MGTSTKYATAHTGTGALGSTHTCDGSIVTLVVESNDTDDDGFIKNVAAFPGLKIKATRAAANITFQWQWKSDQWHQFPSSEGVFTIASTVDIEAWCVDP